MNVGIDNNLYNQNEVETLGAAHSPTPTPPLQQRRVEPV